MRHGVTQDVQTALAMNHDELLREITTAPVREAWVAGVMARLTYRDQFGHLRSCTRTQRMLAELWELLGAQPQIVNNIIVALGARDEAEARRMISIVREAEALSVEDQAIESAEYLARLIESQPELAENVMRILNKAVVNRGGTVIEANGGPHQLPPHANGEAS